MGDGRGHAITQQQAVGVQNSVPASDETVLVEETTTTVEPTRAEQLRELANLRDGGILTEDEFAAQKSKLLGLKGPELPTG